MFCRIDNAICRKIDVLPVVETENVFIEKQ